MTGLEHAVGLDRECATRAVEAQDPDKLLVDVELPARHAQRAGDGEEESLIGLGIAEDGVEYGRQESPAAEAAGLDRSCATRAVGHVRSMRTTGMPLNGTDGSLPARTTGTNGERHDSGTQGDR